MNESFGDVAIQEGRYLYAVINSGAEFDFGDIGINDNKIFTISYEDIAAVVHSCQAEAYKTNDNDKAKEWILAHNYVIDYASKQFGTVLPFAFDCIIRGNDETIKNWLIRNYEKLTKELKKVENKAEYSIQFFCDQKKLQAMVTNSDPELKEFKEKMDKASKGAAYLIKRQFELKLKDAVAVEISMLANDLCSKIKEHVEILKVEKNTSQVPDKYMEMKPIAAFSCLVHDDKIENLGEALDVINKLDGFAVRFTGPWAPFSFVEVKDD
ncbi:MAG: GvpL/GvpF family gas vesicle protein [Candidatus Methanoperedens sp.]